MADSLMHLKILLPFEIFAEKSGVSMVVADTQNGAFGFLPHRLDCVATLVPSILMYETASGGKVYVAVDEGVLVKTGLDITISVREAIAGKDPGELREAVEKKFLALSEQKLKVRAITAKLESNLVSRLAKLHHE